MSIFPKKITLGENCIIHLKFVNHEKNNEVIKYILKVMDPNGKTILNINRNMILGGSSENNFVRELYYNVEIGNHFLPGKYIVDFYLYCKGIKVESITKDIDYFNVEKLSYFTDGKYTYIVNESIEETEFYVFDIDNEKKHFKIKGNDSIVLKEKFNYIQYANSKVDVIKEQSKRLYYKNPEYRLIENRLVNIVNNKEYELTDKEKKYYVGVGVIIDFVPIEFNKFIRKNIFLILNERTLI